MAKNKLAEKFAKLAAVDHGIATLDDKKTKLRLFKKEDFVTTDTPILNLILGGSFDAGLMPGIEVFAAPSGTGKTFIGLKAIESFQKKFKKQEHLTLYFDAEFGSRDMLTGFDIDKSSILHIPITNIEDLHHNLIQMLEEHDPKDPLFVFIDSVGNLASKKELKDALDGKSVADMTRAKTLKAFFRQITPYMNLKNVYSYIIGHTYDSQELYPKKIVSGGTGLAYAPNGVYIIGRTQLKDDKEIIGHEMGITIEKSRTVKRGSKFKLRLMYGSGLQRWSFIPELADQFGVIERVRGRGIDLVFGEYRIPAKKAYHGTEADEFWDRVFKESDLKKQVEAYYKLTV